MHTYYIRAYTSCMNSFVQFTTVYQITLMVYQHLGQISINPLVINQYDSWSSLPLSNTFAAAIA